MTLIKTLENTLEDVLYECRVARIKCPANLRSLSIRVDEDSIRFGVNFVDEDFTQTSNSIYVPGEVDAVVVRSVGNVKMTGYSVVGFRYASTTYVAENLKEIEIEYKCAERKVVITLVGT